MSHEEKKTDNQPGFVFGLTIGAAVGALTAILIKNNSQDSIVDNFETKVKDFFHDLMKDANPKNSPKKIEYIAVQDETPAPVAAKKKSTPKTFVKSKR